MGRWGRRRGGPRADRGGASRGTPPPPAPAPRPRGRWATVLDASSGRAGSASEKLRGPEVFRPPASPAEAPELRGRVSPCSRHPAHGERLAQVAGAGEETCLPPERSPRPGGLRDAQVPVGKGRRGRGFGFVSRSGAALACSCQLPPFPPLPNSHEGTLFRSGPEKAAQLSLPPELVSAEEFLAGPRGFHLLNLGRGAGGGQEKSVPSSKKVHPEIELYL